MFAAIHVPDCTAESHAAVLDCAGAFSPRVEDTAADAVILDIDGMEQMFGSYSEIARRIARQLPLPAHIAIAANPDTALIAARSKAGITVIEPGEEAMRLQDLLIDTLQLDEETCVTLDRWGIHTLGALAGLPAKEISERLGQAGVRLRQLACGTAVRPLVPKITALHFEERFDLDDSIDVLGPLTFILNRLIDQLFRRLRSRGLATAELRLHLERERPHEPYTRVLSLPFPVQNPRIVTRLLMLDLEARPPGAAVIGVRVHGIPAKPRVLQNGLLTPLSPEPEKLELTLARIAAIVGKENVGKPEIADSHARDRFRIVRFGDFGIRVTKFRFSKTAFALRLLRPALEATIRMREGVPVWIAFSGVHGAIETASGPWQSSGDWWRTQPWNREEWDIEIDVSPPDSVIRIAKSLRARIYCNTLNRRWYVEGVYD